MQFLAAVAAGKPSSSRLHEIPTEFWVKLAIGIVLVVLAIIALRKLAKVNKVVLTIIVLVGMSIVGFNWIYERNEPSWATPVVQWLANYFPSKGTTDKHH